MTVRGATQQRAALACALLLAAGGCAARGLTLPSGDGAPFPDYQAAFQEATAACGQARTLTAELAVSGRVGRQKLRGRILAGFERPSSLRLEGVAPFGPPAFILAASPAEATLLLPRDPAVLTGEPPEAILGALVGIRLQPSQLQSVVAGCGLAASAPTGGRSFGEGWARVDLAEGASTFLRSEGGRWQIRAALAPPLRVEYGERQSGRPTSIRLLLEDGPGDRPRADLRLQVSQVQINTELNQAAFTVRVPAGAVKITLEELRQAGPLGQR
ncbi:MAG: hypothetical protein EHM24_01835 [Acidobacteria bacterium]|nr:MAG: hypothetical protein EHM24_01835 [Acidobacteriota bacterium]